MANFDFGEELKKVILAGVGAVASTAEKSKEMIDQFVEKGELTVEQGKVMNEELKRNIKDKLKENVTVVVKEDEPTAESVAKNLDKLSPEELQVIKDKLTQMERENAEDAEVKEAE
ncbi:MAG: DUF2680 domain-containing protein [Eubacterium sp.]